jgi:hypothetical protein
VNKTARITITGRIQKFPHRVENETRSPSLLVLVTLPSKSNGLSASAAAQGTTATDFSVSRVMWRLFSIVEIHPGNDALVVSFSNDAPAVTIPFKSSLTIRLYVPHQRPYP